MKSLEDTFKIPEGSIYMGGIAVCQYIAPNGEMRFDYCYDTHNIPLSSSLGLLELAKMDLRDRARGAQD